MLSIQYTYVLQSKRCTVTTQRIIITEAHVPTLRTIVMKIIMTVQITLHNAP